jgi:two-component system sensor histidine kinase GlrK
MLFGLGLIAIPLLVAVLNASIQIRRLAESSQKLVLEGVQATRYTQELFADLAALERTIRLYQVLGDRKLLDAFQDDERRLTATRIRLEHDLRAPTSRADLAEFAAAQAELGHAMQVASPANPGFTAILARLDRMSVVAGSLAAQGNAQIDAEMHALQQETELARQKLIWESALLVPLTLITILALTLGIGRPIRQIDRSISELGGGTFTHPIRVAGPLDLQRLGRQLEWLRVRLLELAAERNRFLRHLSHELKTPLANIREGTELLMDGAVGELGPEQREVTAILRDNGIKLQRMIENLLSFSAWQTESVGLEASEFRLRPLVKQVLENQQLTLLAQRVRLDVRVADLTLVADRGKLRLILENLLSNAIKYSPKGGTIHLHGSAGEDVFQLDLADTGPGIPNDERGRIFDAFYTGKAPSGHVKGTGIGLSVVLEFVNAHQGTIEIVDGEFPGAHFRLRMPMRAFATGDPQPEIAAATPGSRQAHAV